MKKINVNLSQNPYPVYIGRNIVDQLNKKIIKHCKGSSLFFVIDSRVNHYHGKLITKIIKEFPNKTGKFIFNSTEKNKSYESLNHIYEKLINGKYGRDTAIIAIGGGITGDIAGFAAATYMRGVEYVQVPTTLLADIDSSVGGKTGFNFGGIKNIIGAFHQPKFVLIDTSFLTTLDKNELICGLGEALKYSFIATEALAKFFNLKFKSLLQGEQSSIAKLIEESIEFKSAVVESDEKESGLRKILNLGHTFAHAIEAEQKNLIKHGQAVVAGIVCSIFLSQSLGILNPRKEKEFLNAVNLFKGSIKLKSPNADKIYRFMQTDKKNRSGDIKFVLIQDTGKILLDISAGKKLVLDSIKKGIEVFA